jgi:LPXTG-site transpeptidase (sortase) family protein
MNSHRVTYDTDGNIIIHPVAAQPLQENTWASLEASPAPEPELEERVEELLFLGEEDSWSSEQADEPIVRGFTAEEPASPAGTAQQEPETVTAASGIAERLPSYEDVVARLASVSHLTREAAREGLRQYSVSLQSGGAALQTGLEKSSTGIGAGLRRLGRFLAQPVWIPTRRKGLKEHTRGMLFLIDIVRFGGTFAVIFGVLFISLNYQSFWDITSSGVEKLVSGPSLDEGAGAADNALLQSLQTGGGEQNPNDLFSFLPTVGPPDNRMIIPKLHLNVPLVTPKYDSLLRQDWNQVEKDIQDALRMGVVHYPGTAKPGQAGNFFVTGHSSYYPWDPGQFKTVFARLHELDVGDEYWVYFGGDKHRYVVRTKKEVSPSDITVLDQPANQRLSTLMTCTPVGTTLRRLIIQAEEVDPTTGVPLKVGERAGEELVPKVQLEALPI